MPRHSDLILKLTKAGALIRLNELALEQMAIRTAFPGIGVQPPRKARRRRQFSDAERKAIGKRMKAYWAKQREQKQSGRMQDE